VCRTEVQLQADDTPSLRTSVGIVTAIKLKTTQNGADGVIHKIPDDVQAAIEAKVSSGQSTDEEAVLREAMASLNEFDEDAAKLQTAIQDWRSGDAGLPLDQAAELVRGKVEGRDE